jgi:hypothetical protein
VYVSQILQDVKKKEKFAVGVIVVQGLSAKAENAKNLRFPAAGRKKIAVEGSAVLKKGNMFAGPEDVREANVLRDYQNVSLMMSAKMFLQSAISTE